MSAIPPQIARRLDRLARGAHRFHRFAHHPLCDAYAGELLRLGRRLRLCRGCTCAAAGALAGVLAGATLPVPSTPALLGASAVAVLAAGRAVRRPRSPKRAGKLLTRAAPVTLAAAIVTLALRTGTAAGAAVSVLTLCCVLLAIGGYRRRGPDRAACQSCPERASATICSGFQRIARREVAFGRLAGRLLRAVPPSRVGVTASPWARTTRRS